MRRRTSVAFGVKPKNLKALGPENACPILAAADLAEADVQIERVRTDRNRCSAAEEDKSS